MSIRTKAKRSIIVIAICSIMAVRPAVAFIWPTFDFAQVGAFISGISNGVSQVANTKSQIENTIQTINSVGDQVTNVTKYMADLKNVVAKIGEFDLSSIQIDKSLKDAFSNIKDTVTSTVQTVNNTVTETVQNVGSQIDNGATEEEVQSTLKDSQEEIEEQKQELEDKMKETGVQIEDMTTEVVETIKTIIPVIEQSDELTEEEREEYKSQAEELLQKAELLKTMAENIINSAQTQLDTEYAQNIQNSFDEYSQKIAAYYAGEISREELDQAGEKLQQDIASNPLPWDENVVDNLLQIAEELISGAQKLQEEILNSQSNSREYSEEDEEPEKLSFLMKNNQQYFFQYSSNHQLSNAKGIYVNKNNKEYKTYILPKELLCKDFGNENDLKKLGEKADKFRECVTLAKAEKDYVCVKKGISSDKCNLDPYTMDANAKELYKAHRKNGVYAHIVEDYSIANIQNNSRIQQYIFSWLYDENGTLAQLSKLEKSVDNTRNANVNLGMIEIEAPRLWSMLRTVDALQRSKEATQQFKTGKTLYLDGRDKDFSNANSSKPGLMKNIQTKNGTEERQIFSNLFLYNCGQDAEDISVAPESKFDKTQTGAAERNISKCLFQYAAAANGRYKKDKENYCSAENQTLEQCSKTWKEKAIKAINDTSFQTLTLATINNYKSSKDYAKVEDNETNIASLQEDMKQNTVAVNDYASGAQINYYTTMQILSIVEADAQNLQTDILKYLPKIGYNYFDQRYDEE